MGNEAEFTASPPTIIPGTIVLISGQHVYVESGVHVVASVEISGQPVQISGQHVFVESGARVVVQSGVGVVPVSGIGVTVQSGLGVSISGQHVFVESGVRVVVQSGVGVVPASGVGVVVQSGYGVILQSGLFVNALVSGTVSTSVSGQPINVVSGFLNSAGVSVATFSGLRVVNDSGGYYASGVGVQVQSGIGVLISGQHVFVESGVYLASGVGVISSGVGVTVQSGIWLRSGSEVTVFPSTLSGLFTASGIGVIINSGVGVILASGIGVSISVSGQPINVVSGFLNSAGVTPATFSGLFIASGIGITEASGLYYASGVGVIINSGVGVTVQSGVWLRSGSEVTIFPATQSGTYTQSGVWLRSGSEVTVYPATLSGLFFASGIGVTIASGVFPASGVGVIINSGVGVTIGSGAGVTVNSGVGVLASVSGQPVMPTVTSGASLNILELARLYGEQPAFTERWNWLPNVPDRKQIFYSKYGGRGYADSSVWKDEASGAPTVSWSLPIFVTNFINNAAHFPPFNTAIHLWNSKDGGTTSNELYIGTLKTFTPPVLMRFDAQIPDPNADVASGVYVLFGFENNSQGGHSIADLIIYQSAAVLTAHQLTKVGRESFNQAITLNRPGTVAEYFLEIDPPYVRLWQEPGGGGFPDDKTEIQFLSGCTFDKMQAFVCNESVVTASGFYLLEWEVNERVSITPDKMSGLYLASGLYHASGIGVVTQSGIGVVPASGVGVLVNSGVGITLASGIYPASGVGVMVNSGVGVTVQSGVWLRSGSEVTIFPATLSGLRVINDSGGYYASGVGVTMQSGTGIVDLIVPTTPIINNSGNPLLLDNNSGGVCLWSASVVSVTVKALASNSGDVYLGGSTAGQMPYSGQGFVLSPSEAINIDVDNTGKVKAICVLSGWGRVSYMGVQK